MGYVDFHEDGDFYYSSSSIQLELGEDRAKFSCEGTWSFHGVMFPAEVEGVTELLSDEELERLREEPSYIFHVPWDDWWVEPLSPSPEEVNVDNVHLDLRDLEEGEKLDEDWLIARFLREAKGTTFEEVVSAFLKRVEEEYPYAAAVLKEYWEEIQR